MHFHHSSRDKLMSKWRIFFFWAPLNQEFIAKSTSHPICSNFSSLKCATPTNLISPSRCNANPIQSRTSHCQLGPGRTHIQQLAKTGAIRYGGQKVLKHLTRISIDGGEEVRVLLEIIHGHMRVEFVIPSGTLHPRRLKIAKVRRLALSNIYDLKH